MKKWINPIVIAILFVGTMSNGLMYYRQVTVIQNDENRLASLQTDVARMGDGITSLNGTLQTLTENVSSLSGLVSSLQTDIVSTKDRINSLTSNLQVLTDNISSLQSRNSDFTSAVPKVKPSVVVIQVETVTGNSLGQIVVQQAAGSGWIINEDGIIVTNEHVVANADSIVVTLDDGRTFPSVAVQRDVTADLAVVRIDVHSLPAVRIGDSDRLQVGQPVAAIGNALGLGINMTGGWVSRLNASVTFGDGSRFSGLIETDAAINPGNSGGPLITTNGEVVGITNAKLVGRGVESIGYAISMNNAIKIIDNLIARLGPISR